MENPATPGEIRPCRKTAYIWIALGLALVHAGTIAQTTAPKPDFIRLREFIYMEAPFKSAHASTIVETPSRKLMAAWFGGTAEGNPDVRIWLSGRRSGQRWSPPVPMTDTLGIPAWNPVLFQDGARTWLFFKIGPSPREWVGGFRTSEDDGLTWTPVTYLPAGLSGPARTKPIKLRDGAWLAGTSVEAGSRLDSPAVAPYKSWAGWVERSTDHGVTWSRHGPITVAGEPFGVIQPTLWETASGEVRMLMRSTERIGRIVASSSKDHGLTWEPGRPTLLPNPNAGIDVVRMKDGRLVLVYNHLLHGRDSLHIAISTDEGNTWSNPLLLEAGDGEYSYPAIIQSANGFLHITYTWRRSRIRHVVIDPLDLPQR
jgi:predicted neuraminidase